MSVAENLPAFQSLGLSSPILKALEDVGYETPSPIQAESIPPLLEGSDLLGQAQTGTGKTAAFALPLLSRMDITRRVPQLLVLAPTRELAIQVAEAFQKYAHYLKDFHVLPIYGGQSYDNQLRQLKRGVQVVVGTPGRVMDHIRRGTLKLDGLQTLVLDEADEMLRMGFIDDVEWILQHTPDTRQIALFSATMPKEIQRVTKRYLNDPTIVKIASKTSTATTIRQRYWQVSGLHKLDALTRILEVEEFDGMIIFVRTKTATVDLAEKLAARGYACEALNGDIQQKMREKIVDRLKSSKLDILVATDVVARGLDVQRISHVVNYDIPTDTESYVHRIGRTGRAGRSGDAILFVAPRERRLLQAIERATKQTIERMEMPSTIDINQQRIVKFKQRISDTLASEDLELFHQLVSDFQHEQDIDPIQIAAALARLAQGNEPLLLSEREPRRERKPASDRGDRDRDRDRDRSRQSGRKKVSKEGAKQLKDHPDVPMQRFRIEVGYDHEVKPGNIVGAIANEGDIEFKYIGHIEIYDQFSTVDLPEGMPKETMHALKKARVCGRKLEIHPEGESAEKPEKKERLSLRKDNKKPAKRGQGKARDKQGKGKEKKRYKPKK